MPRLPIKPQRNSYLEVIICELIEYLAAITPRPSASVRPHTTSVGTTFHAQGGNKTTSVPASGWNYRGDWAHGPCDHGDVVRVGDGFAAGIYLCMIDGNNNAPDTGLGWIQISSFSTWL